MDKLRALMDEYKNAQLAHAAAMVRLDVAKHEAVKAEEKTRAAHKKLLDYMAKECGK